MIKRALLAVGLALTLSGCLVQSLNPFYTKDLVVPMPAEMKGEWERFESREGEDKSEVERYAFTFSEDGLIYQDKTGRYDIGIVYFKIGDQLFIDLVLNGSRDNTGGFLSAYPHNLVRVILKDGGIELWWPYYSRMGKLAEEQKVAAFIDAKRYDSVLLIDKSDEIVRFLKTNKDDPDLYGEYAEKWVLKRSAK